MAIILKEGKTFNPAISENYGIDMTGTEYYAVIDKIEYDKKEKTAYFSVDIYSSKDSRNSERPTVTERVNLGFSKESYDETIGAEGLTIIKAYTLALAHERFVDWKSDE